MVLSLFRCNISLLYTVVYKLYIYNILFTTLFNNGGAKSNFPIRAQHIVSWALPDHVVPLTGSAFVWPRWSPWRAPRWAAHSTAGFSPHVSVEASVTLSVCLWKRRLHKWRVFDINSCHQIPEVYTGGAEEMHRPRDASFFGGFVTFWLPILQFVIKILADSETFDNTV